MSTGNRNAKPLSLPAAKAKSKTYLANLKRDYCIRKDKIEIANAVKRLIEIAQNRSQRGKK